MISEIAGVIGSINAAKDIVAGLNAIENQAAINEVKIELQKLLMGGPIFDTSPSHRKGEPRRTHSRV